MCYFRYSLLFFCRFAYLWDPFCLFRVDGSLCSFHCGDLNMGTNTNSPWRSGQRNECPINVFTSIERKGALLWPISSTKYVCLGPSPCPIVFSRCIVFLNDILVTATFVFYIFPFPPRGRTAENVWVNPKTAVCRQYYEGWKMLGKKKTRKIISRPRRHWASMLANPEQCWRPFHRTSPHLPASRPFAEPLLRYANTYLLCLKLPKTNLVRRLDGVHIDIFVVRKYNPIVCLDSIVCIASRPWTQSWLHRRHLCREDTGRYGKVRSAPHSSPNLRDRRSMQQRNMYIKVVFARVYPEEVEGFRLVYWSFLFIFFFFIFFFRS